MLLSINKRVRLEDLNYHGCARLAPILLGDVAWKVIKDRRIMDWDDFRTEVDRRFGLSASDLQEALYSAKPAQGEQAWAFICRVEDERAKMN